ncbi:ferredoxin [Aliiroseovarius crassostreae]|uniref:ferredoxin n=1 Tax=Aliiroseovarius crassostreae TaxID=154981 RepID=UPI002201A989|nr:ferredoxin [Aliiroseovarius crassostreae]UWQ05183.1 ferredoxin [Aliiroseovarius crassostreae]
MSWVPIAEESQLEVFGMLHDAGETIVLLGPHEPGFWARFSSSSEYLDGAPDPLDRWSKRMIGELAKAWGGQAVFPSDGPPYPPFFRWAQESGRAWPSPVTLLVHDRAGLWVSFRGAIRLAGERPLPKSAPAGSPCQTCPAPCTTACPVAALTQDGYDLPRCHAYLDTEAGKTCLEGGCMVRVVCPLSQTYGRLREQSHFHMKAFHPQ